MLLVVMSSGMKGGLPPVVKNVAGVGYDRPYAYWVSCVSGQYRTEYMRMHGYNALPRFASIPAASSDWLFCPSGRRGKRPNQITNMKD